MRQWWTQLSRARSVHGLQQWFCHPGLMNKALGEIGRGKGVRERISASSFFTNIHVTEGWDWGACSTMKGWDICNGLSKTLSQSNVMWPMSNSGFFHHQMGKDKTESHQSKNRGATEAKLCTVLVVSMVDITVKSKVKWSNYNNGSAIQGWRIKRWERYLGWKGARANLCFFFRYLHSW